MNEKLVSLVVCPVHLMYPNFYILKPVSPCGVNIFYPPLCNQLQLAVFTRSECIAHIDNSN